MTKHYCVDRRFNGSGRKFTRSRSECNFHSHFFVFLIKQGQIVHRSKLIDKKEGDKLTKLQLDKQTKSTRQTDKITIRQTNKITIRQTGKITIRQLTIKTCIDNRHRQKNGQRG